MPRKRRRPPPTRLFYAPPPSLREQWPAAFFAIMTLVLTYTTIVRGKGGMALIVGLVMLAAGIFVAWRRRWPWLGAALRADADGLVVNPEGRRAVALAWRDVVGMIDDPSDHSIVFEPRDPAGRVRHLLVMRRGPAVPRNVRTRDGVYFVEVIEDYWEPPEDSESAA